MILKTSNTTRSIATKRSGLGLILAVAIGASAQAQALDPMTQRYPEIRLAYKDLTLNTSSGRQALVERVDATAADHCARYGDLIVPYERRGQPYFCRLAVRGEILRAMPHELRAEYDAGRREAAAVVETARSR